ncbi:MAG: hypothetical protein WKF30_17110, partial [Pyrinomonadaceae bacterium]
MSKRNLRLLILVTVISSSYTPTIYAQNQPASLPQGAIGPTQSGTTVTPPPTGTFDPPDLCTGQKLNNSSQSNLLSQ